MKIDSQSNSSKAEPDYILVTPVYNEELYIGKTIESVLRQTILPREWVIVSDHSTDGTEEIIASASEANPWIRLLRSEDTTSAAFERVVNNTEFGISNISEVKYQYIGLLDADVSFQQDYFECLLNEFESNPKLGLAGGVAIDVGRSKNILPRNRQDVPGALQFFSRECFESLGGLIAIPQGGWDCLTCAMSRMNGYETKLVTSLIVDHLKPRNISQGSSAPRRAWQMGVRDYVLGYNPIFELLKCIGRYRDPPMFIAAFTWWLGYMTSFVSRPRRIVPKNVLEYTRKEQVSRMKHSLFRI